MDDRRFDELARLLAASLNRQGFTRLLTGLAAAGLALLGGLRRVEAKKKKKGKGKTNKTCQQEQKDAVCHCPPNLGGTHCRILCVEGTGHDDHPYDCICGNNDPNNPRPLPPCADCPINPAQLDPCQPILICGGRCELTIPQCPNLPGCVCSTTTDQCETPVACTGLCQNDNQCPTQAHCACNRRRRDPSGSCAAPETCLGACHNDGDCLDLPDCLCLTHRRQGRTVGVCGAPPPPLPTCNGQPCSDTSPCPILEGCFCNRLRTDASGICGAVQTCGGICTSDAQCPALVDCHCNTATSTCALMPPPPTCSGQTCSDTDPCPVVGDCVCNRLQGHEFGTCGAPDICGGECGSDSECLAMEHCVCQLQKKKKKHGKRGKRSGTCSTSPPPSPPPPPPPSPPPPPPPPPPLTCSGDCTSVACPPLDGCVCNRLQNGTGTCGELKICGGRCDNDGDCLAVELCVCKKPGGRGRRRHNTNGECGAPHTPPSPPSPPTPPTPSPVPPPPPGTCLAASCSDTQDCLIASGDQCVCFTGSNTALITAAATGTCAECLGTGAACVASTECCGQLICLDNGVCGLKPPPPRHCHQHGQSCDRDNDCCAQGICYRGKCGEKDTHCNNDGECAQGYRCQGGPLSPGHRRCRRSGHRRHNRRQ